MRKTKLQDREDSKEYIMSIAPKSKVTHLFHFLNQWLSPHFLPLSIIQSVALSPQLVQPYKTTSRNKWDIWYKKNYKIFFTKAENTHSTINGNSAEGNEKTQKTFNKHGEVSKASEWLFQKKVNANPQKNLVSMEEAFFVRGRRVNLSKACVSKVFPFILFSHT